MLRFATAALALAVLAGCQTTTGQPPLIAQPVDTAVNNRGDGLQGKKFAVAVLPDGCQAWLADDGVEGYSTNRYDRNGNPICSDRLPPGAVIGNPQTTGFRDILPQ